VSLQLAFGYLLTEARRDAKLTQAAVARAMGTQQSAVSDWETGLVVPTIETVFRYFVAVGYASCARDVGLSAKPSGQPTNG
jgi:transcriptional regulator with XRE-family HTH domain